MEILGDPPHFYNLEFFSFLLAYSLEIQGVFSAFQVLIDVQRQYGENAPASAEFLNMLVILYHKGTFHFKSQSLFAFFHCSMRTY